MSRRGWLSRRVAVALGACLVIVVGGTWGVLTVERNKVYFSELAIWEDTAAKSPANARAHGNLGNISSAKREFETALVHYQAALKLQPDVAGNHCNVGNTLASLGRSDEAQACYEKAIEIDPNFADPHNNLASLFARREQFDEAVDHYQKAIQINPHYAAAHYNLAHALHRQGRLAGAVLHWRDAVRLQPNHGGMVNQLAWVLATSSIRDGSAAVHLAEHAVQLTAGRDPRVLRTLAAAYAETGRFAEAQRAANAALRMASDTADTLLAKSLRSDIQVYVAGMPLREGAMQ